MITNNLQHSNCYGCHQAIPAYEVQPFFRTIEVEFGGVKRILHASPVNNRCRGCFEAFYCSKQCEEDHLKVHKPECEKLHRKRFFNPFKCELIGLFNEHHLLGILFQLFHANWLPTDKQDLIISLDRMAKGELPKRFSPTMMSDRNLALLAVKVDGSALIFASDSICADKEIVLTAVQGHAFVLEYASPELLADKEVALAAVRNDSGALKYVDPKLRADREVVLTAVTKNGSALSFASLELRDDKEIVLAAVKQNSSALSFASLRLRGDREVVLAALVKNGQALEYVSPELAEDEEIIIAAL
jgi:uncharacterized protein YdeI (YjbR/CyaY-like superfamily)